MTRHTHAPASTPLSSAPFIPPPMPSPVFRAVSQRSRAQAAKRVNNVQRYLASVPESAPNPFEIGRVGPAATKTAQGVANLPSAEASGLQNLVQGSAGREPSSVELSAVDSSRASPPTAVPSLAPTPVHNPFEVTLELVQRHKLGVPVATSTLPRRGQPDPSAEDGLADSLNAVLAARESGQSTPAAAKALENLARAREAARLAAASSSNPFEVKRPSVRQAEEARPAEENPFLRNVSAEKLQSYARDLKQSAPADGVSFSGGWRACWLLKME